MTTRRGTAWPVVEVDAERALVLEPVAGMVTWSLARTRARAGIERANAELSGFS